MNSEEVWVEHPIGVKVSNLGRVWIPKSGKWSEHFTFGCNDKDGYKRVKYKGKVYKVHRLVAESFIPNPNKLPMVNHIDEAKSNNRVENLEWCTRQYNVNYGTGIERAVKNRDYKAIAEKKSKKVIQLTLDGEIVKEWESAREAGRHGFDHSNVSNCCNNKFNKEGNNVYKGYIWKWAV